MINKNPKDRNSYNIAPITPTVAFEADSPFLVDSSTKYTEPVKPPIGAATFTNREDNKAGKKFLTLSSIPAILKANLYI